MNIKEEVEYSTDCLCPLYRVYQRPSEAEKRTISDDTLILRHPFTTAPQPYASLRSTEYSERTGYVRSN